jgi:hypothetical protein
MDKRLFSLTSMVITHLALTYNPCCNIVDFGSDRIYSAIFAVIYTIAPPKSSRLLHTLQWRSCTLENSAIAGVFRKLSNAYLNSSNVNVLPSGRNVIVARTLG